MQDAGMSANKSGRIEALRKLDVLIGRWDSEAVVDGRSVGVAWTEFEWADGGTFVRQTGDADTPFEDPGWRANSPFPTLSLIGLDDSDGTFTVLYSDARDVFRVYRMTLDGNMWRQWRAAPSFNQRFTGEISADGATITAMWEFSEDGETWRKDFDLIYRRTG